MEIAEINAISEIAMRYENLRMQVASTNIAFANQVASTPSQVFKPMQVKMQGFDQLNSTSIADIDTFIQQLQQRLQVSVEQNMAVKPVHNPEDPMADAAGFVYKPDVNMVNEMLTLTTATRAYEANIRAFNTAKDMSRKALEIGK
jgi:flagellar basal-body rod protein FlgC